MYREDIIYTVNKVNIMYKSYRYLLYAESFLCILKVITKKSVICRDHIIYYIALNIYKYSSYTQFILGAIWLQMSPKAGKA